MSIIKKKVKVEKPAGDAPKFGTLEEAQAAKVSVTSKISLARDTFRKFIAENGLKKGKDYEQDKKHGPAWSKLNKAVESLENDRREILEFISGAGKSAKSGKKRGSSTGDANDYGYPAEVLNAEDVSKAKSLYRTKVRARAAKAGLTREEYMADIEAGEALIAGKSAPKKEKKAEKTEKKVESKGVEKPSKTGDKKKSKTSIPPVMEVVKKKKKHTED